MKRMYTQQLAALLVLVLAIFSQTASAKEWYEGGTLHDANGLEWQQATYANKLATAGGLVAIVFQAGRLTAQLANTITGVDDVKPLAAAVVKEMDDYFSPNTEFDVEMNNKMLVNQNVSETVVILMAASGWLKEP